MMENPKWKTYSWYKDARIKSGNSNNVDVNHVFNRKELNNGNGVDKVKIDFKNGIVYYSINGKTQQFGVNEKWDELTKAFNIYK
jgi:hypothetical protein